MNGTSEPSVREERRDAKEGQPCCPVCLGGLIPQRGAWRCVRCGFSLCVGCDSSPMSEYVGASADQN